MARTNEERLAHWEMRLQGARDTQARNQRYADEGASTCQVWADYFEGVALDLEQKIYELKLQMQA